MLVWFSAPFDLRGGLRIGWALSLPPHEVLTSTPALSSFYVTIIASSEEFPPGQQQIGSQTVSKYHLPKMMMWILIILHLPRQHQLRWHKWALAGNKLLNHLPFSEKVIRESLLASRTYYIFALDWFILKVVVHLVPHFHLPLSVADSFAKP